MARKPSPRILIVDDEVGQLRALFDTLRDHGYEAIGVANGVAALEALQSARFELLLTDLMMPGMDGITLLQHARSADADLVGIVMTGEGSIATAVAAIKNGAQDYILKPFKLGTLLPVLARALAVRDLRVANARLERQLRERAAELEAANQELEAFVFSVSHDLRSPLTAIIMTSEELIEDYSAHLPAEAQASLRQVLAGGERMTRLIADLLRLSRLGRQPLTMGTVEVSGLFREVLEELRADGADHGVDVRIGDLADCAGDRSLLKHVFTNLLSNALKFTRNRPVPIVEVTCDLRDDKPVYSVRDNGAGFDNRAATELFGAFRRFHDDREFEGTGVGLSIVRRIVERHGGRIWAKSEPGQGATFSFTLPACFCPRDDRCTGRREALTSSEPQRRPPHPAAQPSAASFEPPVTAGRRKTHSTLRRSAAPHSADGAR